MKTYKVVVLFLSLISCNRSPSPKRLQEMTGDLVKAEYLNYSSGSSLILYKDSLFLMGDDARELLVLDTAFNPLKSVVLFPGENQRQRKAFKADIEAGALFQSKTNKELYLLGSGSVSPYRDSLFKLDIRSGKVDRTSLSTLYSNLLKQGIAEINIEGAAFINEYLFLANRSNLSQKKNYFIQLQSKLPINSQKHTKVIPLILGDNTLGISGLDYYRKKDMLLITLSSEATASASADGKIGSGALGIITNISKKANADSLSLDRFLPFTAIDTLLSNTKVESVAVGGREKGRLILYLVADNDNGRSILYKVKLKF